MIMRIIPILLIIFCSVNCFAEGRKITIVYNNVPYDKKLQTSWGIAVFIQGFEKNILFDTGGDGTVLLSNMNKLQIFPKNIDIIFLSHIHGDHTGGLKSVLEKNNKISVYLPNSFPGSFKENIKPGTATSFYCKSYLFIV